MKKQTHLQKLMLSTLVLSIVVLAVGCSDPAEDLRARDGSATISADRVTDLSTTHKGHRVFTAQLTGEGENPDVTTSGKGQAIIKVSKDGTSLSFKLIVHNLEGITQAHIHCGTPNVNGPAVAFLFHFTASGVTQNGILAEGTITASDVIVTPDTEQCMGGIANFAELLEKIQAGETYVNVHTLLNPGGEIRGQLH